jgi:hypothetical protein
MKKSYEDLSTWWLRVGIILYPSYFILDWFIYPRQKFTLLAIRVLVAAYLLIVQSIFSRIKARYRYFTLLSCFFVVSFGISLMCYISGEGFDSPYYVGILQIVIILTLFTSIAKKEHAIIMAVIIVQHFVLLLITPWTFHGLLLNIFGIVIFAMASVLAHNYLYDLARENKELRGILPICARCKKIRDDAGYWNEVATFIKAHSEVEFSHGICPDCMRELYPDLMDEVLKEAGERTRTPADSP